MEDQHQPAANTASNADPETVQTARAFADLRGALDTAVEHLAGEAIPVDHVDLLHTIQTRIVSRCDLGGYVQDMTTPQLAELTDRAAVAAASVCHALQQASPTTRPADPASPIATTLLALSDAVETADTAIVEAGGAYTVVDGLDAAQHAQSAVAALINSAGRGVDHTTPHHTATWLARAAHRAAAAASLATAAHRRVSAYQRTITRANGPDSEVTPTRASSASTGTSSTLAVQ
jgi:hypothetical protein